MSNVRIAINGLGRIGRCVLRAVVEQHYQGIDIVAANGPAETSVHEHLLRYDSVHGTFRETLKTDGDTMTIGNHTFPVYHERDPKNIPWKKHDVDVVLECTGIFTDAKGAALHLEAGAKKVLISAPAKDSVPTVVYGVNHKTLKKEDIVASIGSCTTNCLAPVAKVLNEAFGIESGFMTTIHSYTGDQNIVDSSHKDLRRARAAAMSMVPTSTGAAKALGLVLPELAGKLDGTAIRVPTPNVSLVDLCFNAGKDVTKETINDALKTAANGALKGVLAISKEPLVSIDFNHNPHSSIADLTGTFVTGKRFARVASWYDNEWGFSCRMLDVSKYLKEAGLL
ncbi:MAG: type I glyceraldehyde-3-phosphate dehydrogenase [Rickettsiales bacterium]